MIDRISAEMDRRAAAMFREADAVAAQARSGQLTKAGGATPYTGMVRQVASAQR